MGFKDSDKSYAQRKRESFPYRKKYLEHNRGILGIFYRCSLCGKIITRDQMEVDHIIPISKWYAPNRVINCVATCRDCNRSKSNTPTKFQMFKSITSKILEEIVILFQNIILALLRIAFFLSLTIIRSLFHSLFTGRSIVQKGLIVMTWMYITYLIFI